MQTTCSTVLLNTIKGAKTEWDAGLVPTPETVEEFFEGIKPEIEDRIIQL